MPTQRQAGTWSLPPCPPHPRPRSNTLMHGELGAEPGRCPALPKLINGGGSRSSPGCWVTTGKGRCRRGQAPSQQQLQVLVPPVSRCPAGWGGSPEKGARGWAVAQAPRSPQAGRPSGHHPAPTLPLLLAAHSHVTRERGRGAESLRDSSGRDLASGVHHEWGFPCPLAPWAWRQETQGQRLLPRPSLAS